MMKSLVMALVVLWSVHGNAADDGVLMTFGEPPITLKKVAYDAQTTKEFNDLVWDFHKADQAGTQEQAKHFGTLEAYEQWAKGHVASRATMLQQGLDELVLFYQGNEIIGGSYFVREDEGKTIRITCAGYKLALDKQQLELVQLKTFEYFGSKQFFLAGEKLIVLLRNYSSNADKLKLFGFSDSTYVCDEFPNDQYNSYERKIS